MKVKDIMIKSAGFIANRALDVTTKNANSTCMYLVHQEKMPENAKKLRKF